MLPPPLTAKLNEAAHPSSNPLRLPQHFEPLRNGLETPIYLRRAIVAGTTALLAVAGVAVGAAPSYAAGTAPSIINGTGSVPTTGTGTVDALNPSSLNGCPTSTAGPGLAQQPIQASDSILTSTTSGFVGTGNFAPNPDPNAVTPSGGSGLVDGTCNGVPTFVIGTNGVVTNQAGATIQGTWDGVTNPLTGNPVKTVSGSVYIDPKESRQVAGLAVYGGTTGSMIAAVYTATDLNNVQNPINVANNNRTTANVSLTAGWNVYNSGSGAWTPVGSVPAGTNGWSTIEITIDPNNASAADVYINGVERTVTAGGSTVANNGAAAGATTFESLSYLSLIQYNDGIDSYDSYWSNLSTSPINNSAYTVNRLGGSDRYATAVAVAQSEFPNGLPTSYKGNLANLNGASYVPTVVLATGENYADALSGAPLAAKFDGALLLTQTNSVPSNVLSEIVRLNPGQIIVLGGFGAVAQPVYTQLQNAIPGVKLVQVGGADRYATSLQIAENYFSGTTAKGATATNFQGDAFIATGTAFPDALSAAPAAGANNFPVLLVNGTSTTIPSALAIWLKTNVTQTLYVAGGSGAVSPAVVNQLASNIKGSVVPFSGTDRYDTNFLINGDNVNFDGAGTAGQGFFTDPTTVYLATGLNYPDALTGGAAAGYQGAPLFLTNGTCVPANVLSTIASWGTVSTINVLGGTGAQSADIAALKSC